MLTVKHVGLVALLCISCAPKPKPKIPERVVVPSTKNKPKPAITTHSIVKATSLKEAQKGIVAVTYPEEQPDKYTSADKRLAKKILVWKKRVDHNLWVECGKRYKEEELPTAALEWANAINQAYRSTKAEYRLRGGKKARVDIREATGIIINESRFDRCGVGPYPRRFAYEKGLLKKNRAGPSHTLEEIEAVFTHPDFAGKKADLGPGQIVKRIGKKGLTWDEAKQYLTVVPGVQKVFSEMAHRGHFYNTTTPSAYWPGAKKSMWYTHKVLRRAMSVFDGKIPRRYRTRQFTKI